MTCPVVYEFWAGRLPLYVGVTNNFRRRLREHRQAGYMNTATTHIRLSFFQDRADAEEYELCRIGELRPARNVFGNPDRHPVCDDAAWDAETRDWRQGDLDYVFAATTLGPTPTFSARQRQWAQMELTTARRAAAFNPHLLANTG